MNEQAQEDTHNPPQRLLVHGPGLPAQGALLPVTFGAQALRVEEPDGVVEVPYDQLTTRPGGWSGESLLLEWDTPHGARSLLLDQPRRFAGLVESLPPDMRRRLDSWRHDVRRNRRVLHGSLVVVIAATMLPLIGISILMLNAGAVARRAVDKLPDAWVQQLDQQAVRDLHVAGRLRERGVAAARFRGVATALADNADAAVDWTFLLVEDPRHDAVALPGGTVVLWSGLMREMHSDAELAGVLAHQMAHVIHRHTLQQTLRQLGLRTTLGLVVFGDGTLGEVDARTSALLTQTKYTRPQEAQARQSAERLVQRAGWEPSGYDALVQRLDRLASSLPAILETHPRPDGRQRALETSARAIAAGWQAVLDDLENAEPPDRDGAPTPG